MLAVERRNRIEQIINKNKSVLVVELAKQFEVTTETIRGDPFGVQEYVRTSECVIISVKLISL